MLRVIIIAISLIASFLQPFRAQSTRSDIDSLQHELQQELSDKDRTTVLMKLGQIYEIINLDSAKYYIDRALLVSDDLNDSTMMRMQNILGTIHVNKGQYDKAIVHFMSGLKLSDKIGALHDRQKTLTMQKNIISDQLI